VSDDIPQDRLDQLRAELVAGIPRFERRRRRARLVQAAAGVGLASVLVTAVTVARDTTDGSDSRVTTGDMRGVCPAGEAGYSVESISDGGVPAVLLASNINSGAVTVTDLDQGCRAVYPDEAHTMGGDVLAAAFTNDGQLVAESWGTPPLVYPAGRTAAGQHVLVDGGLTEPADRLPEGATGDVFPTDSGDGVWFMPGTSDTGSDKPLGFVDLATGETHQVTVPGGSLLVDVDGDNAIVHPAATTSFGGSGLTELAPGHDMLMVTPSGETATLAAPESASFVARTAGRTIWIAGGLRFRDAYCPCGDQVIVVADDGTTTTIPVPDGEGGQWRDPGPQSLGSPSLRTMTRDGTRLLLHLTNPDQPEATPTGLAVVDLEDRTADVFPVPGDAAFWSDDDRTAIVVEEGVRTEGDGTSGTLVNTVTAVDTSTGDTTTIDDALPDGFDLIAAR
jgi:hypothetical protein